MSIKLKTKLRPKISVEEKVVVSEDKKLRIKKKAAEYITLQKQLEEVALTLGKKAAKLAVELKAYADETRKSNQPLMIKTKKGTVKVSEKSITTEIIKPKRMKKLLGKDTWEKLAKVSITDARKYLNPEELAEVTKETQTGSRRISYE